MVNYILVYGNDVAALDAENAVITDVLPDAKYMEYEGAEPSPTSIQGNVLVWNISERSPRNRAAQFTSMPKW